MTSHKYEILKSEIVDHNENSEQITVCAVEVQVDIEIEGKIYGLLAQTTLTHDYGAISSKLAISKDAGAYDNLLSDLSLNDDDEMVENLMTSIMLDSNAQHIWNDYIEENYKRDDRHFGGMDANSEINAMTRKGVK